MFKKLEKAWDKVIDALANLAEAIDSKTEEVKGMKSGQPRRMRAKVRPVKVAKTVHRVKYGRHPIRQKGLTEGIMKALEKKNPAHVGDIVGLLPSFGYSVADERKTKLATFQTLNRLLKVKKVERLGRGEYKLAVG
jgi:hypothetical protein